MIPHIIHQTWKTKEVPAEFRYLRDTWLKHHPGWQYRLWTDADNRAFLAAHYPEFLSVYDGYQAPICRADAIRCFLLKHFGGLYVDLDFECFRSFDDLLDSQSVILGLEPSSHVRDHARLHKGLERLVCNALMASPAQHPFWDHVIEHMVAARHESGPLDATGPFLLTRAVDSYRRLAPVEVMPAELFYPADVHDGSEGRLFDLENWHRVTSSSYAMHHWAGTWWREAHATVQIPSASVRITLTEGGRVIAESALHARACPAFDKASPLVSCLMVTRNRSELAMCAVNGFLRQTYPARELVVIDDGVDGRLQAFLSELAAPNVRYLRLPDEGATLGALRNRALAAAAGVYVCQWDDDDLYDPARLATQMAALAAMRADACFLGRWALWWPRRQRLAISTQRVWEGSMLCRKAKVPPYPAVRRGEDTPGAEQIARTGRVVFLDQPRLYVYAVHDGNTFEPSHFESHWQAASPQFTGAAYERVLQELRKGLDIDGYLSALDTRGSGAVPELATTHPGAVSAVAPAPDPGNSRPQHRAKVTRARRARSPAADLPTILILTPAKNAARFVPRYFELVARLDYPRDKLSLALLEGDSEDGTYEALQRAAERHRRAFARIDLHQHSYSFVLEGDRWEAQKQYSRRSVISKCRNKLFAMADRGADRILWIDADVIDYEAEVLLRLIDADRPIVVPHCVQTPAGPTFDLNSFKFKPAAQERAWTHMVDGIIQPPRGWGRLYLDDFRGDPGLVELDGVGGTMLLVDAAIHRQGIVFPDYSYRGYLDTEGFAFHARDRGFSAWGLPDLEIIHASE